jgi:hypothetical protein
MSTYSARMVINERLEKVSRERDLDLSEYLDVYISLVDNFAKEMIQNRDWRTYCEEVPEKIREKCKFDFLPK